MKIRLGFVTNSSSSSFIIATKNKPQFDDYEPEKFTNMEEWLEERSFSIKDKKEYNSTGWNKHKISIVKRSLPEIGITELQYNSLMSLCEGILYYENNEFFNGNDAIIPKESIENLGITKEQCLRLMFAYDGKLEIYDKLKHAFQSNMNIYSITVDNGPSYHDWQERKFIAEADDVIWCDD